MKNNLAYISGFRAKSLIGALRSHHGLLMAVGVISICLLSGCEPRTGETLVSLDNKTSIDTVEMALGGSTTANKADINVLPISCRNKTITKAFQAQRSAVQVKGCGKVKAVLADDTHDSRHQRFIVELDGITPKHTVLITHNIDLAPKIVKLQKGDEVVFYGQYEYNNQGGVVHWTHHDPAARHQHGWVEHEGQRFQ